MAVAYDASSFKQNSTTVSSFSWSHTCSGSDRVLLVGVSFANDLTTTVTGITYNGDAMSLLHTQDTAGAGNNTRGEMWELIAPDTGTNTIVVTLSGTSGATPGGLAVSLNGATSKNTSAPATANSDPTVVLTTTKTNTMMVMFSCTNSTNTITPGSNVNERQEMSTASVGAGRIMWIGDKAAANAGANTIDSTVADRYAAIAVAYEGSDSAAPAPGVTYKRSYYNSISRASTR